MKTMRCFLAFKLNLETAESIAATQQSLKGRCAEAGMSVRWVPPPNIHMTLLFLGEITEPMTTAVKDMLAPVVADFEEFEVTSLGMGAFPDIAQPKVIWTGLGSGAERITAMHAAVKERLGSSGFLFADKPFAAHVTIGRVKSGPPGALTACFGEDAARDFGKSTVRHLHCFMSEISPGGAEYTTLWALPLQRPATKPYRKETSDSTGDAPAPQPQQLPAEASTPESADTNGEN